MKNSRKIRYSQRDAARGKFPWVTAGIAALMLALGFLGGYLARPLLSGDQAGDVVDTGQQAAPADAQAMMANLVAQTRHFKGDPNAPVTLLEFSDYQ